MAGKEEFAAKVITASGDVKDITLYVKGLTEDEKAILTDACKIFSIKNKDVYMVEGEVFNIKITYPYDLKVAHTLLKGKDCDD